MITIVEEKYKINQDFFLEKLETISKELNVKEEGTIVIKLGDKEEALQLNQEYLGKDYPADVLSFPFNEELPDGFYIGDIFICYPVAKQQAKRNNILLNEELLRLMIHGILHLQGYDHETDAGEMLQLQEHLIKKYMPVEKL